MATKSSVALEEQMKMIKGVHDDGIELMLTTMGVEIGDVKGRLVRGHALSLSFHCL